jgi:hypothetical protein
MKSEKQKLTEQLARIERNIEGIVIVMAFNIGIFILVLIILINKGQ